jgi:hypothetical protein
MYKFVSVDVCKQAMRCDQYNIKHYTVSQLLSERGKLY